MKVYTDTNFVIASIVGSHPHHAAGKALIRRCERIYTFDEKGFQALAPDLSKRIVAPS